MQNSFYKDLFDSSNDLIQSISPRGEILYANKTWLKKLGYKKSELKDLNIFNIIHKSSRKHCRKMFEIIMSNEASLNVENVKFIKKNGDTILLEGNVSSKFEDYKPVYTRGIFRDITDKANTEQNLEILNHITQKLNETNELDQAYSIALDKVCELQYVDIASIYLVDKSTNEAVLQDHRNLSNEYLKKASRIPYPKGITWKTIKSGKVLNVKDIQKVKELGQAARYLGIRSFVGIPINLNKKTIGVFWLLSLKEHYFNRDEIEFLNSIGNHIAIAIGRSKSYKEISKKNRYEVITNSVLRSIHESIDLKEVMKNSVNSLFKEVDSVDNASIFLVEGKNAVLKSYKGYPHAFMKRMKTIPYPKGFTWKTIIDGKILYCSDTDTDKYIGPAGKEVGTKSYLAVPIKENKQVIGCIHINSLKKNAFDESELKLMDILSKQIGTAIKNARQAEDLKNSEQILKNNIDVLSKKKRHDEISNTILKSVHKSLKIKDIMENAVEAISNNMPEVENIMIFLIKDNKAICQAHKGFPKWLVERVREIPYGKGFTWKALLSGKLMYVKDAENDQTIGQAGKELGTKSYIAIPIKLSRKTIGVISINSLKKNAFESDDVFILKIVSKQLEIAINNANKAEDLSRSQDELKNNILLLKKKNRYDEIISNITRSVHQSIDLDLVMNNSVDSILNTIDTVNNVSIYFVEGKYAVIKAHKGYPKWFIDKVSRIPYPKGFTWKTINDGKSIYCPNTDRDKNIGPAGIKAGTKSYFSIPFKYKDQNIGCINFNSRQTNAFDKGELSLLEIVATQIETAIKNAKLASEIQESEQRFFRMADEAPVMIWMSDTVKECNYVNNAWLEFTGRSFRQEIKDGWIECVHKDDVNLCLNTYKTAFDKKNDFRMEYRLKRYDGEYRWIFDHGIPRFLPNGEFAGYIGSCIDIDDRITSEKKIKQSLHEKELLLKELHHRVKNNLQIISSLLSLQTYTVKDKKTIEIFESSRARIDSMALIHEQLYSSPDFDRIDLSVYIKNLCKNIRDSLDQNLYTIKLNLDIEKFVKDINFAVPFSLILNELVSNAFKHAFPQINSGNINIELKHNSKKEVVLRVSDDGIGLPENISIDNVQSMGMQLITALALQLHAEIKVERNNGTLFELRFMNTN